MLETGSDSMSKLFYNVVNATQETENTCQTRIEEFCENFNNISFSILDFRRRLYTI